MIDTKDRKLIELIHEPGILRFPGAHDALFAREAIRQGFEGVYISGAAMSNIRGKLDEGYLTLEDFVHAAKFIVEAVKGYPVLADADTGFGDAPQNIMRTVQEYIRIGLQGLHMEDQEFPKRCGHLEGKKVVDAQFMVQKLLAAYEAKQIYDPSFVVCARVDVFGAQNIPEARQFEEAVSRGNIYRTDGKADLIFIERIKTAEEIRRYRTEVPDVPLLFNQTEGKSDFIHPQELNELGIKVVIYPVTGLRYVIPHYRDVLAHIATHGHQEELVRTDVLATRQVVSDSIREVL